MENKFAKVPVASHGMHEHKYNFPFLTSINFGDVMPCYYNPIRKGESDKPTAGVFSQLMPIAHNAFATGRYQFKAIFVPFKFVWRPWYAFDQQTEYINNGVASVPNRFPYVTNDYLQHAFLTNYCAVVEHVVGNDDYDIRTWSIGDVEAFYVVTDEGRRVLRILGSLGMMPSWVEKDSTPYNILPLLCYLKAYYDYYYPNQYVGSTSSRLLSAFSDRDTIDFSLECAALLEAVSVASVNFYENSIFDSAWENPVSPNVTSIVPNVVLNDVTNDAAYPLKVTNDPASVSTPNANDVMPGNRTPFIGGNKSASASVSTPSGVITNYVLKGLEAVTNFAKRHQLAGARLLDRFLVSRGLTLQNDSARISYLIGKQEVEIDVSAIANTTDSNLGELAGRGVASTGDNPLSFTCNPDDDGILFVIVSPVPDSNFPVLTDGYVLRRDYLDNYHAEFDKLGPSAVPSRVLAQHLDGKYHRNVQSKTFGFLSRYWEELQERPRLLGDFLLKSKGALELSAYHTFRVLSFGRPGQETDLPSMSYDFIRMADKNQFQRLFYSSQQENLMLFLRWRGTQYKEKLPLGDSFDWSDDELNKKVSVVVAGSQK